MSDPFVTAIDPDQPTQRRPGDFQRSKQGTPYVSDPSGACIKPKRKNDPPQVKRLAYGRPSGFGKQIEDMWNLAKWSERTVALGLAIDPTLYADCAVLVGRDRDTPDWRADADRIVVDAKQAAKAGIAADRGTHAHALTEEDDEERDWIVLAEHGEILGLDVEVQTSLVNAWRAMLEREGLEIVATEAAVVHDGYRMAGTLDRLAKLTRPLRFTLATGELIDVPAGTVLVLDIKSGKRRVDSKGVVMYWQSYAVQIATYAGAVPYDTDIETRGAWPWPVDQTHALIAHLDVLGAIAGQPSCDLVYVDIAAGRHAADLCLAAKAWEKRNDVFSVAQVEPPTAPVDPLRPCLEQSDCDCFFARVEGEDVPNPCPRAVLRPTTTLNLKPQVESLRHRCRVIQERSVQAAAAMAATWPTGTPPLTSPDLTAMDLVAIEAHIAHYETAVSAPFAKPPVEVETSITAVSVRESVPETLPDLQPDEGAPIGDTDPLFTEMQARYAALDDHHLALMARTVGETIAAGRTIHMASRCTMRRCLIVDGLCHLAAAGLFTAARGLATTILDLPEGNDMRHPLGAVVSLLNVEQATVFGDGCLKLSLQPAA